MYTTVPLTMSSTYYTGDGGVHTYFPPNPIRTHVTPLGSAVFNDDALLVSSYSNTPTTVVDSILYSPTSSVILSPYSYTRNPTPAQLSSNRVDIEISTPMIVPTTTTYIDVNSDPDLQKKMSKFFFEKLMNKWLHSDFEDLLDHIVVKGKNAKLVSKLKDVKSNKTKGSEYDDKIDYIAEEVMTKHDVRSFLKKFVTKSGINWWDLKNHMRIVKKSLYKRIKRRFEKMIEEN